MVYLSEQQINSRYRTLPRNLRDVLDSSNIAEIVNRICSTQHLSPERTQSVSMLIGMVILGFLHLEDLVNEIHFETGIDKRVATFIAAEIDRKIFAPIRQDLEKNYSPAGAVAEEGAPPAPEVARVSAELAVSPESIIDLKGSKVLAEAADDKQKTAEAVPAPVEIPTAPEKTEPVIAQPVFQPPISVAAAEEPAPVIIHKETEFRPTTGEAVKRSFGGIRIFIFLIPSRACVA